MAKQRGFSGRAMTVLLLAALCLILIAILSPIINNWPHPAPISAARNSMRALTLAIEAYRNDFNSYPPDDFPSQNGSEVLWWHLCRVLPVGEMKYGPYLEAQPERVKLDPISGKNQFLTPFGGTYFYKLLKNAKGAPTKYVIVDPGRDLKVEGAITTDAAGNEYFKPSADPAADDIISGEMQ